MPLCQYNVLFVDDEEDILKSIRRALRSEPYQCLFTSAGQQALEIMASGQVHVLVTDMHMPQISGSDLLKHTKQKHPEILRLVLSGSAASDTIVDAVNSGQIFSYIVKPWNNRELKIVLRQALEVYQLQEERRALLDRLEEQNRLLEQKVEQRTQELLKIRSHAEIGKYASQIVHNLNNPLHAVSGALDFTLLLIDQNPQSIEEIKKTIKLGQHSVRDLQRIVAGILDHARDNFMYDISTIDVNSIIEQELEFFDINPVFHKFVKKDVQLDKNLPTILGNKIQVKQIIDNLIRNAIDAMEHSEVKQLTLKTAKLNNTIIIEVHDTGKGIDEEHLHRIFQPEFSTKPMGKGIGLGLASVKAMVQAYDGDIQVHSQKGSGTVFTIRFPVRHGFNTVSASA